jgi:glycyl-tRNA synthetase
MEPLYDFNGLVFWTEEEILLRRHFEQRFAQGVKQILRSTNRAWDLIQVEAPLLTPTELLSSSYSDDDRYGFDNGLSMRPETTPGSYAYLRHILSNHSGVRAPICVWQVGKSFRREQEKSYKHMRLQEFYQQEFQCLYSADTMNDYHAAVLEPVAKMISTAVGLPYRVVPSDRLPSYSETTMDVELDNGDKWMEVCSISRRTDFPDKVRFTARGKKREVDALVLEIAIGLDRCVYNHTKE